MKRGGANGTRATYWTFMKAKRLWRWSTRRDGSQTNNCSRLSCNARLIGQFSRCRRSSEWHSCSAVTKTKATRKSERFLGCRLLQSKACCFAHGPSCALRLIAILSARPQGAAVSSCRLSSKSAVRDSRSLILGSAMRRRHFLGSVRDALANDGAADPPKKQTPRKWKGRTPKSVRPLSTPHSTEN